MSGWSFLRNLIVAVALFFMALPISELGAQARAAGTPAKLRAGGFGADSPSSWPVYIAKDKGFFAEERVDVSFTRSYEQMVGLLGGSFNVIDEAADSPILAADKGADTVVVYDLSHRPSQFMVLGPGVNSVNELEGKLIGVWKIPSTDQLLLQKYLARQGIDLKKVRFRKVGGSRDRFAALQAGQISGTVLSTTYALRAQKAGMKLIASPADWDVFPWTLIILRRQWAEANQDIVTGYIRAIHRGTRWLYDRSNFEEAVRLLAPVSGFDESTTNWALDVSISQKIFNLEKPRADILQLAADWLLSEGILNKAFDASRVIDTKYYERAVR